MYRHLIPYYLAVLLFSPPGRTPVCAQDSRPFKIQPFTIQVVDEDTGRGVPLIELRTTSQVRFHTDSNGIVAFSEPGLMGRRVFFHVSGHGYEFPRDGFGYRGKALDVSGGGRVRIEVKRINIAERLYRITGEGIYRDSLLVGEPAPIRQPALNALVTGQDSVLSAVSRGKIHWFWGDTNRPGYPLGNFHTPGATSELPGRGGLDPSVGIDLEYFEDGRGFARPTAELPGKGPTWMSGLAALDDETGRELLFAHYVKVRGSLTVYERGLAEFDHEKKRFEKRATFEHEEPFPSGAHPFRHEVDGVAYIYYCDPYPLIRVPADPEALARQESYQAFTPLEKGSRLEDRRIDRDQDSGRPRYGWKANTAPVRPQDLRRLIRDGLLKQEDSPHALRDVDSGKSVLGHRGTVAWNAYRKRWVMIAGETHGTSMLGEIWYAEADRPEGPWVYARKIVTHDRYSFYNPKHHPFFDQDGGRLLYFEGTYTTTFSGNPVKTPRYDYNQILYRLDLNDPRLNLPVAVYETSGKRAKLFTTQTETTSEDRIAFWALERPGPGTTPVYQMTTAAGNPSLQAVPTKIGETARAPLLFHALRADTKDPPTAVMIPLYEFRRESDGQKAYGTGAPPEGFGAGTRLVYVWRHPLR